MVPIRTIHDLFEHVMINQSVAVIGDGIRDNILEGHLWLTMLPEQAVPLATDVHRTRIAYLVCGIASFVFLPSHVNDQACILISSQLIVDRVRATLRSVGAWPSDWLTYP